MGGEPLLDDPGKLTSSCFGILGTGDCRDDGNAVSAGVQDFGQSGDVPDLYAHFGIDADTIVGAALDLVT